MPSQKGFIYIPYQPAYKPIDVNELERDCNMLPDLISTYYTEPQKKILELEEYVSDGKNDLCWANRPGCTDEATHFTLEGMPVCENCFRLLREEELDPFQ